MKHAAAFFAVHKACLLREVHLRWPPIFCSGYRWTSDSHQITLNHSNWAQRTYATAGGVAAGQFNSSFTPIYPTETPRASTQPPNPPHFMHAKPCLAHQKSMGAGPLASAKLARLGSGWSVCRRGQAGPGESEGKLAACVYLLRFPGRSLAVIIRLRG